MKVKLIVRKTSRYILLARLFTFFPVFFLNFHTIFDPFLFLNTKITHRGEATIDRTNEINKTKCYKTITFTVKE
jgi:ATP/ADP translocase